MGIPAGPDIQDYSAELAVQRDLTRAFIAADEDQVVLTRKTRAPNGSGGYVTTTQALASQPARLIPLQSGGPERLTLDGRVVQPGYALLLDYDADLARFDTFAVHGRRYEVVFVNENQDYELKGEVVYHGDV